MKMIFLALLLVALSACSSPDTQQIGELHISSLWSKATPPGAPVAGGFLTIDNRGALPDRLLRVESAAAQRVEIHEMRQTDGMARMRHLADGLPLPAKQVTELKSGGAHLMFIQPKQPFVEGQSIPAVLVFERAGSLAVSFHVQAMTAASHGAGRHH
jgi:copper(I)-binding protein